MQAGRYVGNEKTAEGEMLSWGEWEPESDAQRIEDPIHHARHYVHMPC